ncbi:AAA family ATPase [Thermoleophilia bacterium SCSIO 60948]|nr:AAA family ATPase [Thermoleophilia bacterium SCSIO 60948]
MSDRPDLKGSFDTNRDWDPDLDFERRTVEFVSAADIEPERTKWLWSNYVPLGMVTVLAGRQGLGKSTLAVRLSSLVTRGKLPGELKGTPRSVIYASAEDALAQTLVPRLKAAGADLRRVHFPSVIDKGDSGPIRLPQDVRDLAAQAERQDVALVVLDPGMAFLGGEGGKGFDSHRDHDTRRALSPLTDAAEEHGFALLSIMHLNKSTATADALTRISGSVAFTAAPRSVLVFASDPSDPDGLASDRVLAQAKSNVGKLAQSRSCSIETKRVRTSDGPTSQPYIRIGKTSSHSATELVGASNQDADERSDRAEAKRFIEEELADGSALAFDIQAKAKERDIKPRTLKRAKADLAVRTEQQWTDGKNRWVWTLEKEGSK